MTKPQRDTESQSRLRGYNHNFKYRGKTFHIQTENYGYPRCYICSHVFISGQVVKRIKTEYPKTTDELLSLAHLKGLMLAAHRQMFQLLKSGAFDGYLEQDVTMTCPELCSEESPVFGNSDIEHLDEQLKTAVEAFKTAPAVSRRTHHPAPAANAAAQLPPGLKTQGSKVLRDAPKLEKAPAPRKSNTLPPTIGKSKRSKAQKDKNKVKAAPNKADARTPRQRFTHAPAPARPRPEVETSTRSAAATQSAESAPEQNTQSANPAPEQAAQNTEPAPKQAAQNTQPAPKQAAQNTQSAPKQAAQNTQPAPKQAAQNTQPAPKQAAQNTQPAPAQQTDLRLSPASQELLGEFSKQTPGIVTLALFETSTPEGAVEFTSGPNPHVAPALLKDLVTIQRSCRNPDDPSDHPVEIVTKAKRHFMTITRVNDRMSLFLLIERAGGNLAIIHHRISKAIPGLRRDLEKA